MGYPFLTYSRIAAGSAPSPIPSPIVDYRSSVQAESLVGLEGDMTTFEIRRIRRGDVPELHVLILVGVRNTVRSAN